MKIVLLNQAANYLTIGFANALLAHSHEVVLLTGSVHRQGEALDPAVRVRRLARWRERPAWRKALSYLTGLVQMLGLVLTTYRRHAVFFVSVPPMGYLLNLLLPNRFAMVIWDVYPDIFKIVGASERSVLYRLWAALNRRSFAKADVVITISEKMADLLAQYMPREKITVLPIWSIFERNERVPKSQNPFVTLHGISNRFVVQYSGNIGLTHRVEVLVELAELMAGEPDFLFQIIGRGPRKPALERLVASKGLPNCQFLPFQSDHMFPYSLSAADVGVVILDEATGKGSVPSKSYNLMRFGIPSLYIASPDSQLNAYAQCYGHAACVRSDQLSEAADYLIRLKRDPDLYARHAANAERASRDFSRSNADRIAERVATALRGPTFNQTHTPHTGA